MKYVFASIALHRRVPPQFAQVSYEIPKGMELTIGQLVEVPFRKQLLPGIVVNMTTAAPKYKTRPITAAQAFCMPANSMRLAQWMARQYDSTLRNALDTIMPEQLWDIEGKRKRRSQPEVETKKEKIATTTEYEQLAQKCFETSKKEIIILEKKRLDRKMFYTALVDNLTSDEQALFLVPETDFIELLDVPFTRYHGELSDMQKAHVWRAVAAGMVPVVIGTRSSCLLPFPKLKYVVVDFEHSEHYKEQRNPSYDAREVVEKLGATIISISPAPRMSTWHTKIASRKAEVISWEDTVPKNRIEIIDMADERRKGVTGALSEIALESIARCLAHKEQVMVLVPRRGYAGALWCNTCNNVEHCPECKSLLTPHKNNRLRCHRCGYERDMLLLCTNCSNVTLKNIGIGTEKIELSLNKTFALSSILRVDKDTYIKQKMTINELQQKIEKADLIIGTQMLLKPFALPRLTLIIFASSDMLFTSSHFQAEEESLQIMQQLITAATNPLVIIQTLLPTHPVYASIQEHKLSDYYKKELSMRKILSLPPYPSALNGRKF